MGFRDVKAAVLAALDDGDYGHEPREVQEENNLLALGEVSPDFVAGLIRKTTGNDYSLSAHHADASVEVHVFKPRKDNERWYVKAYFAPQPSVMFISVHRS